MKDFELGEPFDGRIAKTRESLRSERDPYFRARLHKRIRSVRLEAARIKGTHTEEEWLAILGEFEYRCVRCGCVPFGRPCKDHIRPLYLGGSDGSDNLQPLCREFNTEKGYDDFNWAEFRRRNGFVKS